MPKLRKHRLTSGEVHSLLQQYQGPVTWTPRYDPISELVFTILTQHTSDNNALKAFNNLIGKFPEWQDVLDADDDEIAKTIFIGGLSKIKAPRIKSVLKVIKSNRGSFNIDFLSQLTLTEAKNWLKSLPGVGPKTAAVVLAFALNMPAMPVDTHIYRVSKRLGLIGKKTDVGKAHDILEKSVDTNKVFSFHVYLIQHGRTVCKARKPLCNECVMSDKCQSAFKL